MNIKHKLRLQLGINFLLIGIIGIASYFVIHTIHLTVNDLLQYPIPSILRLSEMTKSFLLATEDYQTYQLTGDTEEKESFYRNSQQFETLIESLKHDLGYGTPDIPAEDIPLIEALVTHWEEFQQTTAFNLALKDTPVVAESETVPIAPSPREIESDVNAIVGVLDDYRALESEEVVAAKQEIETLITRVLLLIVLAGSFVTLAALIINGLITRSITAPLARFQATVAQFGAGTWEERADEGRSDELGSLAKIFNTMANDIEHAQVKMETTVKERTEELKQKFAEVEQMNALMTGRELKMIELKQDIQALKQALADRTEAPTQES